jgi:hypothetical protein
MANLEDVREAAQKRFLFLPHAVRQMFRPTRMIIAAEVETLALQGELIEDYPNDPRGHSCLLLGFGDGGTGRCTLYARRRRLLGYNHSISS